MRYAAAVVAWALKAQEVICRVLAGTLTWLQGADILGIRTRSLRRWRTRYEQAGLRGLHDRRRGCPSRRTALRQAGRVDSILYPVYRMC